MSRSYSIDRSLTFNDSTGYWNLTIEVTSSTSVSPFPFLLEKAVLGTEGSNTLSSSQEQPVYLRTLLDAEVATQRLVNDPTVYTKFTWVQYRSNVFSRDFYTYDSAAKALESTLAVLKSNANVFSSSLAKPLLVGINLSAKEKTTALESIELTKGDTISLQLINGSMDSIVISDGEYITVSNESTSTRRKSNSYIIKVTSNNMSYIGLRCTNTGEEHTLQVTLNSTPLEGTVSESIL